MIRVTKAAADASPRLDRFQRKRRLALALFFGLASIFLLFCRSWFGYGDLHEFVEAVGLSIIGAAVLGRLWSTLYIGGRKNAEIITKGPYSLTRNPLYVFSSLGAVGVGAQTGSITVAILFGIATAIAFHITIRREEVFLLDAFGADFEAYCRRVPRFLPRFSGFDGGDLVTVHPSRLYSTLLDGLIFFAAIPAFESIEWLQEAGVLPVLFRLP